jgi:hypothetical protein
MLLDTLACRTQLKSVQANKIPFRQKFRRSATLPLIHFNKARSTIVTIPPA